MMTRKIMSAEYVKIPGAKAPGNMQATERHEDYYENTVIRSF